MSIWCSWPSIGWDTWRKRGKFKRGTVLTYAAGFSNHHPDLSGSHELPATIGIDHIAPWCVPGHEEGDACPGGHDWPQVGPWLRLMVSAEDSLSWWVGAGDTKPARTGPKSMTVVMDERAVRALRRDLGKWLKAPKVQPRESA